MSKHVEVKKMKVEDAAAMAAKQAFSYIGSEMTPAQIAAIEACEHAYSIFIDGTLKMVAGVTTYWPGRGEAWAILDPQCKTDFMELHHVVKRFLDICPVKRIEAAVECEFTPGHRWVKSLGFELEAKKLRAFLPDGKDASLYARVS